MKSSVGHINTSNLDVFTSIFFYFYFTTLFALTGLGGQWAKSKICLVGEINLCAEAPTKAIT